MKTRNLHLRRVTLFVAAHCSLVMTWAAGAARFNPASYRVAEDADEVWFSVVRVDDLAAIVTVDFATTDGTAKAGEDYSHTTGTLTFGAGETNRSARIPLRNDGVREGNETFSVSLTAVSPNAVLGNPATANILIEDNDPGLEIEYAQYRVRENMATVVAAVVRGADETAPVTVNYRTVPQTATAGGDYGETQGTLSFGSAERVKLISIPILNDGLREADERFRVVLENPTGNALGTRTSCTVTVADNDPGLEFQANQIWVHEDEGGVEIEVLRGNDESLDPFSVAYTVTNLTATAIEDHAALDGVLEFAAGEMSRIIRLPVVNDGVPEADERLRIQLGPPPRGITPGRSTNLTCTVTICDATGLEPHRFLGVERTATDAIRLVIQGGASRRFNPLLGIYLLESSLDLRDWQARRLMAHVNDLGNPPAFIEATGAGDARFYRLIATPMFTPCLAPTGPYLTGVTTRRVYDATRRNRYLVSTNGSFLVTIWYPAHPRPGQLPAGFDDAPLRENVTWQSPAWMDRAPRFFSFSFPDAPIRSTTSGYPVVLYSHGGGSARLDNLALAAELASHGYVLASPDHGDCGITLLPDHSVYSRPGDVSFTAGGLQDRVRDLAVVLEELQRWNDDDPLFRRQLNLARLAAAGWSWGGDTAGEVSRQDDRYAAVVSLDQGGVTATTAPALVASGTPAPSLTMNMAGNASEFLFRPAQQPAYWLQLSGAVHQDFSAYSVWSNAGFVQGREAARTVHAYVRSFLNKHLRQMDDHLLDGPPRDFPRVVSFKRK